MKLKNVFELEFRVLETEWQTKKYILGEQFQTSLSWYTFHLNLSPPKKSNVEYTY